MLKQLAGWLILSAGCASAHAADNETGPVPIAGFARYVLLPVTAPGLTPPKGYLRSISDRLLGQMTPHINTWNYPEAPPSTQSELTIALVIDQSKGVSGGSRMAWGILAGDSELAAHIELVEQPSGKLIGRQNFTGSTKSLPATSGVVHDFLLQDKLVSDAVAFVVKCYEQQATERTAAQPQP